MARTSLPRALALTVFVSTLAFANSAHARADDCPPGSVFHSEDGYTFCEVKPCLTEAQCNPEEVCRSIPLCVQIGTLQHDAAALTDAGKRVVATQQCGPDKSCPSSTVCDTMSRCVARTVADRMGILSTTPAGSASTGASDSSEAKKSKCGCRVVGEPDHEHPSSGYGVGLALLAVAVIARRARGARCAPTPPAR